MGFAYYLFCTKNITPGDYYRKSPGEKALLWAMSSFEIEQREQL